MAAGQEWSRTVEPPPSLLLIYDLESHDKTSRRPNYSSEGNWRKRISLDWRREVGVGVWAASRPTISNFSFYRFTPTDLSICFILITRLNLLMLLSCFVCTVSELCLKLKLYNLGVEETGYEIEHP